MELSKQKEMMVLVNLPAVFGTTSALSCKYINKGNESNNKTSCSTLCYNEKLKSETTNTPGL